MGRHRLRDFADPVELWQLRGDGLASEFPPLRGVGALEPFAGVELASWLVDDRGSGLAGRVAELSVLAEAVDDALDGRRRCVLVAGEPGIGKTRLVAEAARAARARGMLGLCCNDGDQRQAGAMNRRRRRHPVEVLPSGFAGFRFPAEVILLAVRWYLRYGLSYRDLGELLAERGIEVNHVTLHRWVPRFTPQLVDAASPCRHDAGDRWYVDETYVRVAGVWRYLYRAVDQFGQVIDVMLSDRRDAKAARRFFDSALLCAARLVEVTTDRAAIYPPVLDELLPGAFPNLEKYANNRVEADHGRLKARLRPDAGPQDRPQHRSDRRRSRLHSGPPARPLRTGNGSDAQAPTGRRVPRARPGDLNPELPEAPGRSCSAQPTQQTPRKCRIQYVGCSGPAQRAPRAIARSR